MARKTGTFPAVNAQGGRAAKGEGKGNARKMHERKPMDGHRNREIVKREAAPKESPGGRPELPGPSSRPGLAPHHERIQKKLMELYGDLFFHDGYGTVTLEMRFLKRGQKEIILRSGKEYRYVVDWPEPES